MDWTGYTIQIENMGPTIDSPPSWDILADGAYAFSSEIVSGIYEFSKGGGYTIVITAIPAGQNILQLNDSVNQWQTAYLSDAEVILGFGIPAVDEVGEVATQLFEIRATAPAPPEAIDWSEYIFTFTKNGETINPPPNFDATWQGEYWHTSTVNLSGGKKAYYFLHETGATMKLVQQLNTDVQIEVYSPEEDICFFTTAGQEGVLAGLTAQLFTDVESPTTTQDLDVSVSLSAAVNEVSDVSTKSRMPRQQAKLVQYARGIATETGNGAITIIADLFASDLAASRAPSTRSAVTIQQSKDREAQLRSALQVAVGNRQNNKGAALTVATVRSVTGVTVDELKAGSVRIRLRGRAKGEDRIWYEVQMQTIVEAPAQTETETIEVSKESLVWVYPLAFDGRQVGIRARQCTSRPNGQGSICGPWSEWRVVRLVRQFDED